MRNLLALLNVNFHDILNITNRVLIEKTKTINILFLNENIQYSLLLLPPSAKLSHIIN